MKKLFTLCAVALAILVGATSCEKDEPVVSSIADYYIEVDVTGGGLNSADLNELKSELNSDISEIRMEGYTKDEAVYVFDSLMKSLKSDFIDGMSGISGTLKMKFTLKTVDGVKIKTTTLNITRNGCTMS